MSASQRAKRAWLLADVRKINDEISGNSHLRKLACASRFSICNNPGFKSQ
jgi:hypothetical protein